MIPSFLCFTSCRRPFRRFRAWSKASVLHPPVSVPNMYWTMRARCRIPRHVGRISVVSLCSLLPQIEPVSVPHDLSGQLASPCALSKAATLQEPAYLRVRLERFVLFPIEQRELRLILCHLSATSPAAASVALGAVAGSLVFKSRGRLTRSDLGERLTHISQDPLILVEVDDQIGRLLRQLQGSPRRSKRWIMAES